VGVAQVVVWAVVGRGPREWCRCRCVMSSCGWRMVVMLLCGVHSCSIAGMWCTHRQLGTHPSVLLVLAQCCVH
jgi:hypothetical protein